MNLFDLHCDTALSLYRKAEHLGENSCHIDLARAARFGKYAQVMANFCPSKLDDEAAYHNYQRVADYLLREADENRDRVALCRTAQDMHNAWESDRAALFCAVEDARLLGGEIDRLNVLAARGVRFLTLAWGTSSCVCGAHNTTDGLTDFGREVVARCFELGIVPDISHGSDATMDEIIDLAREAGRPCIATHSNARAVRDHKRNLTDTQFCAIRDMGGIVGISLCPEHLAAKDEPRDVSAVVKHILHYLSLGGHKTVCLGCDLDGTDLPDGFKGIESLSKIREALAVAGVDDETIARIFYRNAVRFVEKNLTK